MRDQRTMKLKKKKLKLEKCLVKMLKENKSLENVENRKFNLLF